MKRRQFLGIACASTVFINACKKDEPTPTTTVQGTITDAAGKPVVGLEVDFFGEGGGAGSGIIFPSSPYVSFSEKTITDPNGFFKIIKVLPDGISQKEISLSKATSTYVETKKNGVLVSRSFVLAKNDDINVGNVNEYLVTFYQ